MMKLQIELSCAFARTQLLGVAYLNLYGYESNRLAGSSFIASPAVTPQGVAFNGLDNHDSIHLLAAA